jgi:hypothetical protein
MRELDSISLGLAFGFAWALFTFLGGIAASILGWGIELVEILGSIYPGFAPGLWGSLVGAAWGFVNGFLWGAIIGWIYNRL